MQTNYKLKLLFKNHNHKPSMLLITFSYEICRPLKITARINKKL